MSEKFCAHQLVCGDRFADRARDACRLESGHEVDGEQYSQCQKAQLDDSRESTLVQSNNNNKLFIFASSTNLFILNEKKQHVSCKLMMTIFRYSGSVYHVAIFSEAIYLVLLLKFPYYNEDRGSKFCIIISWSKRSLSNLERQQIFTKK